ncbi:hypothetical protein BJX64DRAFT_284484 [Aspergillus heterothallicus]
MGSKALQYVFHHVVFPPKLPLEPEGGQKSLDRELVLFVKTILGLFVSERAENIQSKWRPVVDMIDTWLTVEPAGTLCRNQEELARALSDLKIQGALTLYINAQNCGWMAHYDEESDKATIDAFEVTPTLSAVLEASGPVIRCFPGQSVSIPIELFEDPNFCAYLAQSLCSLDLEELLSFGDHNVWKSFEKHMRDEVNFEHGKRPWRRSPLWFVLKVAIQTILYRVFPDNEGRIEYKNFMLYLITEVGLSFIPKMERENALPGTADTADILAITRAKFARCIYKLQDKVFHFVLDRVGKVDDAIAAHLQSDFERIQYVDSPKLPPRFDTARQTDYETSLKYSRKHLRAAMLDTPPTAPTNPFKANHARRRRKQIDGLFRLDDDSTETLVDFEKWVDIELQDWCDATPASDKACRGLAELMEKYSHYASRKYADIPDLVSLMLLVILECWVALDKLCVKLCSSFKKFSPELSKDLLQPLLLPRRHEMQRAQAVKGYIASRYDDSETNTSIFDDPGAHTFAVLFYQSSRSCHNRRTGITQHFQKEHDDRQKMCQDLLQKHECLLGEASLLSLEIEDDGNGNRMHLSYCRKCWLQQEAKNLSIQIHEWPLPDDEHLIENVIFELSCPEWFTCWRDVTWMIVDDHGRSQTAESSHMEVNLLDYPVLKEFHQGQKRRLTLASAKKSWLDTHYSTRTFPVHPDDIVVSSGLHFSLWDTKKQAWIKDRLDRKKAPEPSFRHLCTFSINATAYSGLQYAVDASCHQQNQVIAEQRTYRSRLDIHDMVAFRQLRSGERLQWYNILRELASCSISLNEEPVHDLFCQATWQLGSSIPGQWLRETHVFFEDLCSVTILWEMLEHKLTGIQNNWNEHYTLHTLVVLGLRSLSLGPASAIERALDFLRKCRRVAMEWCVKLKAKIEPIQEKNTGELLILVLRIGAVCLLTYSVDDEHLAILLRAHDDLHILVKASILVFENSIQQAGTAPLDKKALILRVSRLLCHVEQQAGHIIVTDYSGLTQAVIESVTGLQISSPWHFLNTPNDRWVTTTTNPTSDERQQQIHYNLLTGELRIDNDLPTRLPEDITKDLSFQRLFGSKPLSVLLRSNLKGSRFMSYQLAVPSTTTQGHRTLVDVHSEFFARVSTVLSKLDAAKHIIVTKSPEGTVEGRLIRLHLAFFVNCDGALESREHNAIVDSSQDIGCLYGLSNKLVLRSKAGRRRTVLILYGTVKVGRGISHTQISIESPGVPRIKYYQYSIDSDLGVLLDTSGMAGSLYLAYLHAVTSFVLPDPTTQRSGTEEALRILRQAKMRTSFPLDSECIHLLGLLAGLTPHRKFYPPKVPEQKVISVQKVKWIQSLSSLAQHDDFRVLAQEIFEHASRFAPFQNRKMDTARGLLRGDLQLLDRARYRNLQFYKSQFGGAPAKPQIVPSDYEARDRIETESDRSRRVYEIAELVQYWPSKLGQKVNLMATIKAWGVMQVEERSSGHFNYTSLLKKPIPELWASLYMECQSCTGESDKYKLMSLFCTVAFGQPEVDYLRPLLAIAVSNEFPVFPPALKGQSVELNQRPGQPINSSQAEEITNIISSQYPPLERNSFKGQNLTQRQKDRISRERRKEYDKEKTEEIESLKKAIGMQWPCGALRQSHGMESWKSDCFYECNDLFKRWTRNVQFYRFILSVQNKLDSVPTVLLAPSQPPTLPIRPLIYPRVAGCWQLPSLYDLLLSANVPSSMDTDGRLMGFQRLQQPATVDADLDNDLHALINGLGQDSQPLRQQYATNISESLQSLEEILLPCAPTEFPTDKASLEAQYLDLLEQRDSLWAEIKLSLSAAEEGWKEAGHTLRPSITILSVLSFLASEKWSSIPENWKDSLLKLAKSLASSRRHERLIAYFDNGDINSFYREAEAVGCEGWDPMQIPEWLLMEIEGNLTIRARQADVAQRLIEDLANTVLQLNMGEGKTTVITPMVAVRFSDGSTVSRLVVLKPLLRQSMNLLSQRLGGILNRPVYHIPFSRSTPISEARAQTLREIHEECIERKGVLIVLPEQMLSLRLVGLDLAEEEPTIAHSLLELDLKLQESCRTLIDESDEILDPKFQLVYTRGHQQNLDGESGRWEIIQHVLEEVKRQAMSLHSLEQSGLYLEQKDSRFPILHFLKVDAARLLLNKVLDAVRKGAIPGLPLHDFARPVSSSAMRFIHHKEISDNDKETVRQKFEGSLILRRLLVLRGLFAHNVLYFALTSKRWFVDYGTHPESCLLAVPFRAKGIPSDNAMFGHPEVTLVLTCLSYYYEGLTRSQGRECMSLLKEDNDPGAEYEHWTMECRDQLPQGLHSFSGVNVDDIHGFERELYPHIQFQKNIIDFFLSRIVFPREAKAFPSKLSTSAWDIPSRPNYPLTSGFSGTNDSRYLLPTSIVQANLPELLHTNAMVLARLLRKENRMCILAQDYDGQQLSLDQLLSLISDQDPPIRVIIEVGAQILEASNRQVVEKWLSICLTSQAAAAVFFDEDDEPMLLYQPGNALVSHTHIDDEFLKPVNWVLSNVDNSKLLILSQFEANEFLPYIRKTKKTTLHVYAPRTTKGMRSFGKLDFLTIGASRDNREFSPDILRALEFFSGSLYFDTYQEYERAQQFFGFRTVGTPAVPEDKVTSEGFVDENARDQAGWPVKSPFKKCPLEFLNTWFSIRTKGHGFSKSHMVSIIEAKPMTEKQFNGA